MISLLIQSILALLLVTCILYCVRLERRLRIFQTANQQLGETVNQLSRKSHEAELAIARFKEAAAECEAQIAAPLAAARSVSGKLEEQIDDAETVMNKIGRIVTAASPNPAHSSDNSHQPMQAAAIKPRLASTTDRSSRSRFAGIG